MILLAGVAKVDVIGPAMAEDIAEAVEETFEWSDDGSSPVAKKNDVAAVGCAGFDWAADLDGKSDGLSEEDRDQDQNIFEACNERFHALAMIICESQPARRWQGGCGGHFFRDRREQIEAE